jgi:hypothetical protein
MIVWLARLLAALPHYFIIFENLALMVAALGVLLGKAQLFPQPRGDNYRKSI